MVKRSKVELQTGAVGDIVAVSIPMVDRGRGDAGNMLRVIAVKAGVMKGQYSRNQLDLY
jgi:hypothetical protein